MSEPGGSGHTSRRPRDDSITSFAGIRRESTRSLQRDASRGGGTARGTRDANRSLVSTPSVQRQMNTPSARLDIGDSWQDSDFIRIQSLLSERARIQRQAMRRKSSYGSESQNSQSPRDNGSATGRRQPQSAERRAHRRNGSRTSRTSLGNDPVGQERSPMLSFTGSPSTEEKYMNRRDYDGVRPTATVPRGGPRKPVDMHDPVARPSATSVSQDERID